MRIALWLLALFGVAVAAALFAGSNPGSITVFWPPYRIDLSLNLVLVLLVLAFFTLHLALHAMSALFALPGAARQWRLRQRERAMQVALLDAFTNLAAGRFVRSRKAAEVVLQQIESVGFDAQALPYAARLRAVAHLLVAEATHMLQDRPARDAHFNSALDQVRGAGASETRDGIQLRAARWALDDRDAARALTLLNSLGQGAARRTLALRMHLKAARMARSTAAALETARLLAKHRAMSVMASQGVLRGLAIELLDDAHDPAQLQQAWARLEAAERSMADVAIHAVARLRHVGGPPALGLTWLLPVWEHMLAEPTSLDEAQRVALVRALEHGFAGTSGTPEAAWLARIEQAQMQRPGDALLQYLAGTACMRLQLWGKAQQLLTQCLTRLQDAQLRRDAWCQLAEMAQRNGDQDAALRAWRSAAQS